MWNPRTIARAALLLPLLYAGALSAEPKAGDTESQTQPGLLYRLSKSFDGLILGDDFEAAGPDAKMWEIRQTAELRTFFEGGTLHIKGVWPQDVGKTAGMFGAFSRVAYSPRTRLLNGVMAARIKFNHDWKQEGFDRSPAMQFHFCGTSPDMNASISRAMAQGKVGWGFVAGGGLGGTRKLTVAADDAAASPAAQATLAGLDDRQWQTLFIVQRGVRADGYFLGPKGEWLRVGQPLATWLNAKRIELKMLHVQPGFNIDVEFDDARLYPHPADNPVRVAVYVHDSQDPRRARPFTVKLVTADGKRTLAEAAGGPGGDLFDMTLPDDVLYPVAARLQVFRADRLDAEMPITQAGVRGLYPGDIWEVYCVPPPRQPVAPPAATSQPGPP